GPPAIFEDMSKLKTSGYFAITNDRPKPYSFFSLKKKSGIYMITNKVNKKYYIGMTKDIFVRINNYLYVSRLIDNKSSRLHRAFLKYGFNNFSLTILEFVEHSKNTALREREDYYIKVFKPQYNIVRSSFNLDLEKNDKYNVNKLNLITPIKIKNLLDKALDPALLD
ncbi:GIY-YIG nuclease family protein, partial [Pseudonocardia yuanmonensis]|uniref:GIY-YIG nuclease family protein n=1 Tax=Pseudonocardia yuanmonensis TaxID=1095914 RepID=UPI0031E92DD9